MNPTAVNMALKTGSNLWKQLRDYRQEKSRETYTALEEAAQQMQKEDNSAFDEARKQAGAVTQAAHSRLERALEEFNNYREDAVERFDEAKKEATKKAKKARKQTKKKATKAAKKQTKKDKKSSKFWTVAGIVALLAAATGAIYAWLRSNDKPSQTPPRVDEGKPEDRHEGEQRRRGRRLAERDAEAADRENVERRRDRHDRASAPRRHEYGHRAQHGTEPVSTIATPSHAGVDVGRPTISTATT